MVAGQSVQVLLATRAKEVYEVLKRREDVQYDIALHTRTIKDLLPNAQLVIIDYEDVVEYPVDLTKDQITQEIFERGIYQCSSQDFLANPDNTLTGLTSRGSGPMFVLPPHYCIAFVSYSGGTGRTTLAMDTALYFAATLKTYKNKHKQQVHAQAQAELNTKPALLFELTYGISSIVALTGLEMPSLYQLTTQTDAQIQEYKGVTLVPMDYDNVRMLSVDMVQRYLQQQMDQHTLAVIDCLWPHGLATAIAERVNLWVVAADRPDTIVNAVKLRDELSKEFKGKKVWLLLNQAPKTNGRPAANPSTVSWDLKLPHVSRVDDYRGELGREILSKALAPAWDEYDPSRKPKRSR